MLKQTTLISMFICLILLPLLACGNSDTPVNITIANPLPTLTPTVGAGQPLAPQPEGASSAPVDNNNSQATSPAVESAPPTSPEPTQNDMPVAVDSPIIIISLDKVQELVELQNVSGEPQYLSGWTIISEVGPQKCNLAGTLDPGEILRIWALAENNSQGGYNCGFSREIWDDIESDPAVLINPEGVEASRLE